MSTGLTKEEMGFAVDEYRRFYKVFLSTRLLIKESKVPKSEQTPEWKAARGKLQDHIEKLCEHGPDEAIEMLGKILKQIHEQMGDDTVVFEETE